MDDAIKDALDLAQRKLTNKAPYGVIDMGDKIILGAPHGQPIELSDELKRRVQEVAGKHGAWYEGDAKDAEAHKNLISNPKAYRGSWDDAVAQSVKGYPIEYLAPLFSNVEVNKQHEAFENPQQTIFDSLLANQQKARYFKDRDYDKNTLTNFLKQGSEEKADLMRMAASPATKENLRKFFSTGEKLMWPENWQEYPNKLGQIAKRFEDSRNKFLREAGPGVYITGAGHIPELKNTYKDLNVIGGERAGYAGGGLVKDALDLALRAREDQDRLPMRFSYGPRYGSEDLKDIGFKGPLKQGEHVISEYSADREVQYPSVYEGITPRDLAAVMMAERLGRGTPPDVDDRAYAAAQRRIEEGRSPFYEPGRDPYPKWSPDQEWEEPAIMRADGGPVEDDRAHEFVQEQLNSDEQQLPQYDPEGGMRTAKRLALDAYGITDLGGLQEALGYMPKPEGGYEKSALQHAREGDYLTGSMVAMGALVPGAGKVGKALHGAEDALRLAKNDILPKAAQEITSAGTSVNQVPALFSSPHFEIKPGGHRNLDWGGGRFDKATEFLKERGVESHVYDPFNRSLEHNASVLEEFKNNPADSITMNNVLNVIKEPEARSETIARTKDFLSPNGKAYFTVYEKSGKGVGSETAGGSSWQENRKTKDYLDEIRQHYPNAYIKGKTIIADHPDGGSVVEDALRLTRQMGGETSDEMIERGEWSPFKGLKYRPAPEKLSSEPDIREYQLKRHAHEFEGAPEPVAPKRKVVVDAPLFGGKKELGELPYDYAGMANTALNALYGLKTAPLYASPYTAPVGRALDAYETAKKIEEDPSAFNSYTAIPKLFKGATPLGLGAMGVGATIAAEDEENKAHGGVVADALRVANKRLKGGKINTKIDRDPDWDMGLRRGGIARK